MQKLVKLNKGMSNEKEKYVYYKLEKGNIEEIKEPLKGVYCYVNESMGIKIFNMDYKKVQPLAEWLLEEQLEVMTKRTMWILVGIICLLVLAYSVYMVKKEVEILKGSNTIMFEKMTEVLKIAEPLFVEGVKEKSEVVDLGRGRVLPFGSVDSFEMSPRDVSVDTVDGDIIK